MVLRFKGNEKSKLLWLYFAFHRWNRKVPSAIFWFRAIWLRSKMLPFGAMRIGNDLEMSGVL